MLTEPDPGHGGGNRAGEDYVCDQVQPPETSRACAPAVFSVFGAHRGGVRALRLPGHSRPFRDKAAEGPSFPASPVRNEPYVRNEPHGQEGTPAFRLGDGMVTLVSTVTMPMRCPYEVNKAVLATHAKGAFAKLVTWQRGEIRKMWLPASGDPSR